MTAYLNIQKEIHEKAEKIEKLDDKLYALKDNIKKEEQKLYELKEKRKEILENIVYTHQIEFLSRLSDYAKIKGTIICERNICIRLESSGELEIKINFEDGFRVSRTGDFPESIVKKVNKMLQDFSDKYLIDENS